MSIMLNTLNKINSILYHTSHSCSCVSFLPSSFLCSSVFFLFLSFLFLSFSFHCVFLFLSLIVSDLFHYFPHPGFNSLSLVKICGTCIVRRFGGGEKFYRFASYVKKEKSEVFSLCPSCTL